MGHEVWRPATPIPWSRRGDASATLREHQRKFFTSVSGRAWWVMWCAGAGVTSTGPDVLDEEVDTFRGFVRGIPKEISTRGTVFLSSSAGGIYAGSTGPPFDERSRPYPLAAYGQAKLAMEATVMRWATDSGGRALIGRIGNLYGPGQDMRKPQGLISQLLRAHVERRPLQVYVSLDTSRDYIYTEDAASRIVAGTARLQDCSRSTHITKVIATQRATTIGGVLGEMQRVLRRRPPIVLGASPAARVQARDLRLRSVVWSDLDRLPVTPLPVGIHRTLLDVERQIR